MLEFLGTMQFAEFLGRLLVEAFESSGLTEEEKNWYVGWKTLGTWSRNGNHDFLEPQIFEKLFAVGQRRASTLLADTGDAWDVATDALAIMVGRGVRGRTPEVSPQTILDAVSSDKPGQAFYSMYYSYLKTVKTLAIGRRARLLKQWSRLVKS